MIKKVFVKALKKLDLLSALSIRLVKLTGKHPYPVHPKHLMGGKIWWEKYTKKSDIILDLGAGSCKNDIQVSKKVKRIICFDINKQVFEYAKKEAKEKKISNIEFVSGNANNKLPFPDSSFDKVICSDVLEHLYKRDFAISEIKRVLKKKGYLLLVTDNPNTSWKRLQKSVGLFYFADLDHKYEYPKEEILIKLKDAGFQIESVNTSTFDTPLKGLIDFTGGFSLSIYKRLRKWRERMAKKHPENTTGFMIVARYY